MKTLRREVLSAKPGVLKAAPQLRWRSTTISFGPSNCPENMAGSGVLPIITAPVIYNITLYHVLVDGGAGLNVISYAAFKQLQIPESKLTPSRPFSGVGPHPVFPLGSITLPVTFGTEENFRTESVQFDVAKVNLLFNAIIGRSALYRFMAIAHYGYLVLKMPSPAGVLPCGVTAPLPSLQLRNCMLWRQRLHVSRRTHPPHNPGCLQRHLRFSRLIWIMYP